MENFLLLLASRLVGRDAEPRFKRYRIGRTGCTSLLPSGRPVFHLHATADGERVCFYEECRNGVSYGLITVSMKERYELEKAETILIHYLARIRKPFGVAANTGLEPEACGEAVSLCDYWQAEEGVDWKVKGCSDGRTLAVLYVKNIADCRVAEHDAFLNGFRFCLSA